MAKRFVCYTVTENKGKNYWERLGVAFENQDGSLNVQLFGLPVDGRLQIREFVPRNDPNGPDGAPADSRRRGGGR